MYQQSTHVTLLQRLADTSDTAAWQDFHDRYAELIRGFARRRGLQASDCDDVAQEVLLSLSKAMQAFTYDPQRGKFRSYLKTVTLRTVFRKSCQNGAEIGLEHIEEATAAASQDDAVEAAWELEWRQYHMRQAMRAVAVEFSEEDRRAFQKYAVEGGDARGVAASVGLTVDQVYQAKSRIMKRIAALIETQVREEG